MDTEKAKAYIDEMWENKALQGLSEFITIPSVSPELDPTWKECGHVGKAMKHFVAWTESLNLKGLSYEILEDHDHAPFLYMEIDDGAPSTSLFYGHLDVQPGGDDWSDGLDPWTPVRKDNKLYGRGAVDNGYGLFSIMTAISYLQKEKISHGKCIVIVELTEESGSSDVPFYLEKIHDRLGDVDLVVVPDSSSSDTKRIWNTTSLRGVGIIELEISTLTKNHHSGYCSGVIPNNFDILQTLLARVKNAENGKTTFPPLLSETPEHVEEEIENAADALKDVFHEDLPLRENVQTLSPNLKELIQTNTRETSIYIIGMNGFPPTEVAGSNFYETLKVRIHVRLAPGIDADTAIEKLLKEFERDPPYGAHIKTKLLIASSGWSAGKQSPWFAKALEEASVKFFGEAPVNRGFGAGIPAISMMSEHIGEADWLVFGAITPGCNLHAADENVDLSLAKKVTETIAYTVSKLTEEKAA